MMLFLEVQKVNSRYTPELSIKMRLDETTNNSFKNIIKEICRYKPEKSIKSLILINFNLSLIYNFLDYHYDNFFNIAFKSILLLNQFCF